MREIRQGFPITVLGEHILGCASQMETFNSRFVGLQNANLALKSAFMEDRLTEMDDQTVARRATTLRQDVL